MKEITVRFWNITDGCNIMMAGVITSSYKQNVNNVEMC